MLDIWRNFLLHTLILTFDLWLAVSNQRQPGPFCWALPFLRLCNLQRGGVKPAACSPASHIFLNCFSGKGKLSNSLYDFNVHLLVSEIVSLGCCVGLKKHLFLRVSVTEPVNWRIWRCIVCTSLDIVKSVVTFSHYSTTLGFLETSWSSS